MKLYVNGVYFIRTKGPEVAAKYKGMTDGLCLFRIGRRLVKLRRNKVLGPCGNSHHDRAPERKIALKREVKVRSSCSRQRWAETPPGMASRTEAKAGNAKPTGGRCTDPTCQVCVR